jgi:hypothetical protein
MHLYLISWDALPGNSIDVRALPITASGRTDYRKRENKMKFRITGMFLIGCIATLGCDDKKAANTAQVEVGCVKIEAGPEGAEVKGPGVHVKANTVRSATYD